MVNFNNKILLDNEKYLYYNVLNSREVEIYAANLVETCEKNIIKNIKIPKVFEFNIGEIFEVTISAKKHKYIINHIEKTDSPGKYILITENTNRTSLYLVPLLGFLPLSKEITSKWKLTTLNELKRYAIGSYLINAYFNKKEKILKLKYRFNSDDFYLDLETELKNHKYFLKLEEEGQKFVSIYFLMPDKIHKDLEYFIKGEYSQFNADSKHKILTFLKGWKDVQTKMKQILTKDIALKEILEKELAMRLSSKQELDSKPKKIDFYA